MISWWINTYLQTPSSSYGRGKRHSQLFGHWKLCSRHLLLLLVMKIIAFSLLLFCTYWEIFFEVFWNIRAFSNMCGCKRGQCSCCGTVAESVLPPYKMAQVYCEQEDHSVYLTHLTCVISCLFVVLLVGFVCCWLLHGMRVLSVHWRWRPDDSHE
jgi:hypothetical protein